MKQKDKRVPNKKKRVLLSLAAIFALLASIPPIVSAFVCASVEDQFVSLDEAASFGADAILVLGARVWDNGSPSGILKDRINAGVAVYEAGASDRILMSGDHGQTDYDEVNAMKNCAVDQGVTSESIFLDHAGFSTYESVYRARDIFQVKRVLIVTQRYHLYRALYIANRMGLTACGYACDRRDDPGVLLPDVREILARCKDFLFTIFMPLPTYLGDPIPIAGNGDATNG